MAKVSRVVSAGPRYRWPDSQQWMALIDRIRSRVAMATGLTLVLAIVGYAVICGYMADVLTRADPQPIQGSPADDGLTFDPIAFPSRVDAIPLKGWLLQPPGGGARRPIVVVHGKGSNRTLEADHHMLKIAGHLVRAGYPVLLFDLRGAGESGGERFTLGIQEVRDVGGAIDFLDGRGLLGKGVDLLGYSMGGATALLDAPDEPRVRAVAEDSAYADLNELLVREVPKASGLPGIFVPGMVLAARPLVGGDLYAVRPVDRAPTLAARGVPLLVIHGEADTYVPADNGHRIAAAYGPGAQTLFVRGADHVRSYEVDPTTYIARLTAFFERAE